MTFFLIVKVFNIRNVFFFFFRNDIDTYYRRVMATTLFLSSASPKIFLVILIFFVDLALIGELFSTRYVYKKRINRLVLPKVFILLFCWSISIETFGINLLGT